MLHRLAREWFDTGNSRVSDCASSQDNGRRPVRYEQSLQGSMRALPRSSRAAVLAEDLRESRSRSVEWADQRSCAPTLAPHVLRRTATAKAEVRRDAPTT